MCAFAAAASLFRQSCSAVVRSSCLLSGISSSAAIASQKDLDSLLTTRQAAVRPSWKEVRTHCEGCLCEFSPSNQAGACVLSLFCF